MVVKPNLVAIRSSNYTDVVHATTLKTKVGLLCGLALLVSANANAQSEFADDFSVNSIKYSVNNFNNPGASASAALESGGIRLNATTDGVEDARLKISVVEVTNSLQISGAFDLSATSFADEGWGQVTVGTAVSNDIPVADRLDPNSREGDIYMNVHSSIFSDGSTNLFVCFSREGENGNEDFNLFNNNTRNCRDYDADTPVAGETFNLGYDISEDNTITVTVGDTTDLITLPGTYNRPMDNNKRIEHRAARGAGSSSYVLSSITTDSGTDDFTAISPIIDRYNTYFASDSVLPRIEAERLRVEYQSSEDNGGATQLDPLLFDEYLEATILFDSQSNIDGVNDRISSRLEVVMANDTQDNGFDGKTGDIRAGIYVEARGDGLRRVEYCLNRFDDAEGDNRTRLLNGGSNGCGEFPLKVEFDTAYRLAIDVDRASASVTFRVNGFSYTENLQTALFAANQPDAEVNIGSSYGGYVVGYIDDVRNSRSALTAQEMSAGVAIPTAFPPTPTPESLAVDSTLDVPFDFADTELSFIDDFSSETVALGLDRWNEADASLTYTDGAVELQVHSTRDPEDGGGTTLFRVNGATDSINVRGAVSSDSRLPAGQSNVSLELDATFYNDTVDGGLEDNAGDIRTSIRIEFQGNGQRYVQAELRRRQEDGNNDRQDVFPDGQNRYNFNDVLPEMDTFYDIGIRLDRELNAVIYTLNDQSVSVPISTGIFVPSRNEINVRANHQGASGRAVVRLESIATDASALDFTQGQPVIAPYSPFYASRSPGVSTSIEDGRLRLFADGRITSGSDPRVRVQGVSDYVGADIELSSESIVAADQRVFVDLSGSLFSDLDNGRENDEGQVFIALRLIADGDGTRYVERCAWRSNDENFDDTTELLGGDPDSCPRFELIPEFDTTYAASISVDDVAMTVTYQFGGESFVYNIPTDVFTNQQQYIGVRAKTDDNSLVVAYADNLSLAENPVMLALSDQNFGNVQGVSSSTGTGGDTAGDTGTGGDTAGDTGTGGDTAGDTGTSGGSSGGGGCAVGGGGNPFILLLAMLAALRLCSRRRKV